jgi:hypothetical protein
MPWAASSQSHKRHVWEFFEMSEIRDVDPTKIYESWHWLFFPMLEMLGPELIYSIGLTALEYPPTWANTKQEADLVEAAVDLYFQNKE